MRGGYICITHTHQNITMQVHNTMHLCFCSQATIKVTIINVGCSQTTNHLLATPHIPKTGNRPSIANSRYTVHTSNHSMKTHTAHMHYTNIMYSMICNDCIPYVSEGQPQLNSEQVVHSTRSKQGRVYRNRNTLVFNSYVFANQFLVVNN